MEVAAILFAAMAPGAVIEEEETADAASFEGCCYAVAAFEGAAACLGALDGFAAAEFF